MALPKKQCIPGIANLSEDNQGHERLQRCWELWRYGDLPDVLDVVAIWLNANGTRDNLCFGAMDEKVGVQVLVTCRHMEYLCEDIIVFL